MQQHVLGGVCATQPRQMLCVQQQLGVPIWTHLCTATGPAGLCRRTDVSVRQGQRELCLLAAGLLLTHRRAKQAKPELTWEQSSGLSFPSSSNCVLQGAEKWTQRVFLESVLFLHRFIWNVRVQRAGDRRH